MNKSFFHFSKALFLLLLPFVAQAQSVKLSPDFPSTIKPGESFVMAIRITKAQAGGAARLQLEIPSGFDAKLVNGKGSDFTYQNNTVKFFWASLPESDEFTVSCNLIPSSSLRGKQTITGEFIYNTDDQATHVAMHSCVVNITTGDKTADAKVTSPKVERKIITVSEEKSEYKVELTFFPNGVNESAQFTDILPNDFSALIVDAHESSFSFENQSVIFTWRKFPAEKSFTISYIVRSSTPGVKPEINGTLVYGDAVEIAAPTMASTNPVSKPATTEEPTPAESASSNSSLPVVPPAAAMPATETTPITENTPAAESTSPNNQTQTSPTEPTPTNTATPTTESAAAKEETSPSQPSQENSSPSSAGNSGDQQTSKTYAMASDKKDDAIPANTASASSSGIIFRVQISATRTSPARSSEWFGDKMAISSPVEMTMHEGWKKYLVGSFSNYKEAKKMRNATRDKVYDAFVVAYQNGTRIPLNEAIRNKAINP